MEKLKVGQQFEVVEVVANDDYIRDEFIIGGFTLRGIGERFNHTLANGGGWKYAFEKADLNHNHGLFLNNWEVKPIGRLTITKVK